MAMRAAVLLIVVAAASAAEVSPVEKVIQMMEDLQTQVVMEGKTEAKTYDKFACFCKDMSEEKTWDIEDAQDLNNELTATIEENQADREGFDGVIADMNAIIAARDKTIAEANAARAKSHQAYVVELNDCYTAEKEIDFAVLELEAKEDEVAGASLISLKGMVKTVRKMALMADALGLSNAKRKTITALLQQEPGVPMEDFHFDASEVIKEVKELKPGFEAKVVELKVMESKNQFQHTSVVSTLLHEKEQAEKTLKDTMADKGAAMEKIASSQQALTASQAQMTDDQAYLKELTDVCNARSKDWDQRSKMRQDELTALTTALTILKGRVTAKTTEKTVRLLQVSNAAAVKPLVDDAAAEALDTEAAEADQIAEAAEAPLSFIQLESPRVKLASALQKKALRSSNPSEADARARVLALLRSRSSELNSPVLAALATKVAADPFVKIKKLIQELIERLLQEAADEANHKGWCDKEFGKAYQSRDINAQAVADLNTALSDNEAKRDKHMEEIALLTKQLEELEASLESTTKIKTDETAENEATVKEAQEGKEAIEEAIDVLSKFYKTAAKATLVQTEVKSSQPIPDAGFSGSYNAAQGASTGILGMMEVIKSDFERTISETEKDEKAAQAQFLAFSTETKASMGEKTVAKRLHTKEKVETENTIAEDMASLEENQDLLNSALQQIMELQPACVDTGMSYEERVAKREQEIESLKEALCTLDKEGPEQTEPECS